ncbi:hypothetical protein SLEP1_g18331 [Rubroshorea leprosula]|uniref:Reverse transcriptase domain-containing protein n=1 Tax=Rubroshorea leprosula TaxID=152421 RepID=A0AAV5J5Z8_9ROSI|nr:hypothetical protein SLEP1_g18331 [Rubroshorea leprosula]
MQEKFKYHSKSRVMQLTHLIFVDDIMLFCKADEESTVLMMQKFKEFAQVSGLEVNRMKSQVFFSGVREGQKVALIQKLAWDDVCVPRKEGGLGMKQLLRWNKVALGKLVWNICQHQESLWVKWAQAALLRGENFWKVKIPTDCAWTWRQVLKLCPLLKNIIWMQVGDGRQVSLFYDSWACELRFCELISKDEIAVWGHDLTVSEWWDGLNWTIPDSFVRRHPMLVQIIRCQKLSQQVDKAVWKLAKNGLFTISSCYEFLRVKRPKVEWHQIVWAGCIVP